MALVADAVVGALWTLMCVVITLMFVFHRKIMQWGQPPSRTTVETPEHTTANVAKDMPEQGGALELTSVEGKDKAEPDAEDGEPSLVVQERDDETADASQTKDMVVVNPIRQRKAVDGEPEHTSKVLHEKAVPPREDSRHMDISVLIMSAVAFGVEAVAQLVFAIYSSAASPNPVLLDVFYSIRIFNSGSLWAIACCFLKQGEDFHFRFTWAVWSSLSFFATLAYVVLVIMDGDKSRSLIYVSFVATPVLVRLSCIFSIAIAPYAASNYNRTDAQATADGDAEKKKNHHNTTLLFVVSLLAALSGIYLHLGEAAPNRFGNVNANAVVRVILCVTEPIYALVLIKLVREGLFTPNEVAKQVVVKNQKASLNGWHSFYFSPEKVFSFSAIPQLVTYLVDTILLFFFIKPDWSSNPIYLLYATFHPCVLLDYQPASLVAMPGFTVALLVSGFGVVATFMRAVMLGDIAIAMVNAISMAWYIMVMCCFPLVFIFAPEVSTIGHSVPYMLFLSGTAVFLVAACSVVWAESQRISQLKFRAVWHFMLYAVVYGIVVMFAIMFMVQLLLDDAVGRKVTAAVDENFAWDPTPLFAAVLLEGLCWGYAIANPMSKYPIAFQYKSYEAGTNAHKEKSPDSIIDNYGRRFRVQMPARRPLQVSLLLIVVGAGVSVWSANALYGQEAVASWGLHTFTSTLPGSALMTVIMVPVMIFMLLHVVLVAEHEYHNNRNPVLKWGTSVIGALLVATTITSTGGCIPGTPPWWHGVQAFQVSVLLWTMLNLGLVAQAWDRIQPYQAAMRKVKTQRDLFQFEDDSAADLSFSRPRSLTVYDERFVAKTARWLWALAIADMFFGTTTVIGLLGSMFTAHLTFDAVWVISLFLWSLCDLRKVTLRVENLGVVDEKMLKAILACSGPDAKKQASSAHLASASV